MKKQLVNLLKSLLLTLKEKSGWLGTPTSQVDMAHDEYEALEAHAEEAEEEVGKLRESVETLEAEKKELQESLEKLG